MPELFEHRLLKKIARNWGSHPEGLECGMGDDGSVFVSPAEKLCWVQDMMIEGTHFTNEDMDPASLGHKALAVNLSDLAAMGAKPKYFQISLALSSHQDESWVDKFYEGLMTLAKEHEVHLVGGDLSKSTQQVMVDVSVLGTVIHPFYRSSQKHSVGATLAVSGPLGQAAAGREVLRAHQEAEFAELVRSYQRPTPQMGASKRLHNISNSVSVVDISDGLVSEVEHLLQGRELGVKIDSSLLSYSDELLAWAKKTDSKPENYALWGGEDYQLLALIEDSSTLPPGFTKIGELIAEPGVFLDHSGTISRVTSTQGWDAFS